MAIQPPTTLVADLEDLQSRVLDMMVEPEAKMAENDKAITASGRRLHDSVEEIRAAEKATGFAALNRVLTAVDQAIEEVRAASAEQAA